MNDLWQYGLWNFQAGGTKLEIILPKNRQTQRKLLNFENWVNGHSVLRLDATIKKRYDGKLFKFKKISIK